MRSRRRGGTAVSIASDDDERGLGDRVTKTSDAYTNGYMDGNNSAHAELRVWQVGDHESTCVCEICRTGRVIVEHVLLPDSHIEGCSRPCGESCSCWCHAGGIVERSPRNRRQRAYNRDRVSTPCQRLRRERKEELPHPMLHNRARSRRDRRPALRWMGELGFSYEMAELRHRFPQSLPQLHRESQRHVCPTIVLHRNALSRVELLYSFSYASHQPGFEPNDLGKSFFCFARSLVFQPAL